jgi:DNA polymerase-3 subunit gamma/tau
VQAAWPTVLDAVQQIKRSSWTVMFTSTPSALDGDVLTISFTNEADAAAFKVRAAPAESVSEHVRGAIQQVTGARVKFMLRVDPGQSDASSSPAERSSTSEASPAAEAPADPDPAPTTTELTTPEPRPATRAKKPAPATSAARATTTDWAVAAIPGAAEQAAEPAAPPETASTLVVDEVVPAAAPEAPSAPPAKAAAPHASDGSGRQRYGEAVVREVLGATFLAEETIAPLVTAGAVELPADAAEAVPAAPRDGDLPSSADAPDPFRDEY